MVCREGKRGERRREREGKGREGETGERSNNVGGGMEQVRKTRERNREGVIIGLKNVMDTELW